jgi:hypothetical protein
MKYMFVIMNDERKGAPGRAARSDSLSLLESCWAFGDRAGEADEWKLLAAGYDVSGQPSVREHSRCFRVTSAFPGHSVLSNNSMFLGTSAFPSTFGVPELDKSF